MEPRLSFHSPYSAALLLAAVVGVLAYNAGIDREHSRRERRGGWDDGHRQIAGV